jgi:hypothetical protein
MNIERIGTRRYPVARLFDTVTFLLSKPKLKERPYLESSYCFNRKRYLRKFLTNLFVFFDGVIELSHYPVPLSADLVKSRFHDEQKVCSGIPWLKVRSCRTECKGIWIVLDCGLPILGGIEISITEAEPVPSPVI